DNQCPEWKPLSNGFLKFNVDGAARKDTSRAGIGGVLRDKEQVIRIRFSIAVMVENANMVEVIVIKEVFRIFASSSWVSTLGLEVKSDPIDWEIEKFLRFLEGVMRRRTNLPRSRNGICGRGAIASFVDPNGHQQT
ncbi:hypothetical protein QQP08_019280, partial [Theobroma cacao]